MTAHKKENITINDRLINDDQLLFQNEDRSGNLE